MEARKNGVSAVAIRLVPMFASPKPSAHKTFPSRTMHAASPGIFARSIFALIALLRKVGVGIELCAIRDGASSVVTVIAAKALDRIERYIGGLIVFDFSLSMESEELA
jgi:hypothetical protein